MPKFQPLETVFVLKAPKPSYTEPLLFVSNPTMGGNWVECLDADSKQVKVPNGVLQTIYKATAAAEAEKLRKKHWPKINGGDK